MTDDPSPRLWASMPFTEVIGAELLRAEPREVSAHVAWDSTRCTAGGLMHGGLLMALADSAAGLCAFLNLPGEGYGTATVESKTNFLRGVKAAT